MNDLTTEQLRKLLKIREQIEDLQKEEQRIIGGKSTKIRTISASARRKIAASVKKRWKERKAAGQSKL